MLHRSRAKFHFQVFVFLSLILGLQSLSDENERLKTTIKEVSAIALLCKDILRFCLMMSEGYKRHFPSRISDTSNLQRKMIVGGFGDAPPQCLLACSIHFLFFISLLHVTPVKILLSPSIAMRDYFAYAFC